MTEWLTGQDWDLNKFISFAASLIFAITLADSIIVSARRRMKKGLNGFRAMSFFTAWMIIASSAWIMAGAIYIYQAPPTRLAPDIVTIFKVIAAIGAIGFDICMHWFDNERDAETISDMFVEKPEGLVLRRRKVDWLK